jgi:hypothetical protein
MGRWTYELNFIKSGQMDMDTWTDEQTDRWRDEKMDGWTNRLMCFPFWSYSFTVHTSTACCLVDQWYSGQCFHQIRSHETLNFNQITLALSGIWTQDLWVSSQHFYQLSHKGRLSDEMNSIQSGQMEKETWIAGQINK